MNNRPTSNPSAASPTDGDPLADSRCPECGYPLRGLPENRCPECGRAFDPAEFTGTFLPRWPQLMAWYLAACIVAQLLEFAPALLRWNPYFLLAVKTGDEPLKDFTNICHLAEAAALCLLGPVCILGLCRRRDWARKGCIVIFALGALAWMSYIELFHFFELGQSSFVEAVHPILRRLALEPTGPLAVLVTLFLLTGLRRQSLSREGREPAPMLSLKRFRPDRDWLLLTVVIFIGLGTGWTCEGWRSLDTMSQFLSSFGVRGRISGGTDLWHVLSKLQIAMGLATVAASLAILLHPSWFRLTAGAVFAASLGLRVLELIVGLRGYSPAFIHAACSVLRITAAVMPPLALTAFAFLAIGKDDIRRLKVEA